MDRADLSKNVLRGFTAFDLFLEQHPEFKEQVTFIAHLIPSRQDVPEYAEYLERIEALVAVVNHRHGTTDWMPIDLRLRENLEEAIAAYKHYDLLMVNAMFDGMNLIAKEGPLVNERNGVSLLSENTGAHEELADFALSVNPFDVQDQADAIHRALTHVRRGALLARPGAQAHRDRARPRRLGRRPAGRHRVKAPRRSAGALRSSARARVQRLRSRSVTRRALEPGSGVNSADGNGVVGGAGAGGRGGDRGRRDGRNDLLGCPSLRSAAPHRRGTLSATPPPPILRAPLAVARHGPRREPAAAPHGARAPAARAAPPAPAPPNPGIRGRPLRPRPLPRATRARRPTLAHRTRRQSAGGAPDRLWFISG